MNLDIWIYLDTWLCLDTVYMDMLRICHLCVVDVILWAGSAKGNKQLKLEDVLNILAAGFLRGGTGFLKAGEMIKGGTNVNREIRVGVTHVG